MAERDQAGARRLRRAATLAMALVLSGCVAAPKAVVVSPGDLGTPPRGAPPVSARLASAGLRPADAEAQRFARVLLEGLQERSIRERREYCGFLSVSDTGEISATRPRRGTLAGCSLGAMPEGTFATYHTHGAWDFGYDNEVPSASDLESDFLNGVDGYVSTPGGRFWHVDLDTRSVVLVCGRGCLTSDPGYQALGDETIRPRFTLAQLYERRDHR